MYNPSFHLIFHFLFHLILHYWGNIGYHSSPKKVPLILGRSLGLHQNTGHLGTLGMRKGQEKIVDVLLQDKTGVTPRSREFSVI